MHIEPVEIVPAAAPEIQSFKFSSRGNPDISADATGRVDQQSDMIFVEVKYTSAMPPYRLIPEFTASGEVTVGGIVQTGGFTEQDFSYALIYMVRAADDIHNKTRYRVQVSFIADSGSNCEIQSFGFLKSHNPSLSADVSGTIDQRTGTITVLLPYGAGSANTDLRAEFETEGRVYSGGIEQVSGVSGQRFNSEVLYAVRSINGRYSREYKVIVQEVGGTLFVNPGAYGRNNGTSWQDAFINLETTLSYAQSLPDTVPLEIYLAKADYTPSLGKSFIVRSNVSIYGGFSGTESSPLQRESGSRSRLRGNGRAVCEAVKVSTAVLFDGLDISGGSQGGIYVTAADSGTRVSINACSFENNTTSASGGGLYVNISQCHFSGNKGNYSVYLFGSGTVTGYASWSGITYPSADVYVAERLSMIP